MTDFVRRYGKAAAAVLAAVLIAAHTYLNDGRIVADEGVLILLAGAGAVLTWLVPLTPQYPWLKTAVMAVIAALEVLAVVILDGINHQEVITVFLAVLGVLGVGGSPARSGTGVSSRPQSV